MKKVLFSTLLAVAFTTASAQPGGGMPRFGNMPKIDVKFNEYVTAPAGFHKARFDELVGTDNTCSHINLALERANQLVLA